MGFRSMTPLEFSALFGILYIIVDVTAWTLKRLL